MDKLIWRKGGRAASIFLFCCNKYAQTPLHHFEHTVQGHCVCLCVVCNYDQHLLSDLKKIQTPNSHLLDLLNNNSSLPPARHLATPTLLLIHMNLITLDALGGNVLTHALVVFLAWLISACLQAHLRRSICQNSLPSKDHVLLHCPSMSHSVCSLIGI